MYENKTQEWWDNWFLGLAKYVSTASKDPSTKTGAVIVGKNRDVVSIGYNGFARKVKDTEERYANRDLKYKFIVHCERNAILFADRHRLVDATLYTYPFLSCSVCAGMVVQSGIKRCVAPEMPDSLKERWEEDTKLTRQQFEESGIKLDIVDFKE